MSASTLRNDMYLSIEKTQFISTDATHVHYDTTVMCINIG